MAESFSCGLIHSSFLQLSRASSVFAQAERLRRRFWDHAKSLYFLGVAQSTIRIAAPLGALRPLRVPVRKEEAKLVELEMRSRLTRKQHERDVASLQVSLGSVALTKHRAEAQWAESR